MIKNAEAMKTYEPDKPLIFLHIPKTAGVSIRKSFENWYQNGFFRHYYSNQLPPKRDLKAEFFGNQPSVLYGHFNGGRGFGADQYYPEVSQFVTFLRDPWERELSGYFFAKKMNRLNGQFPDVADQTLEEYLLRQRTNTILNHLPKGCTSENFQEVIEHYFVEVGIVEKLEDSMYRIADKLGFTFDPAELEVLNSTPRDQDIPVHLKADFIANMPFEYKLYEYALSKYR